MHPDGKPQRRACQQVIRQRWPHSINPSNADFEKQPDRVCDDRDARDGLGVGHITKNRIRTYGFVLHVAIVSHGRALRGRAREAERALEAACLERFRTQRPDVPMPVIRSDNGLTFRSRRCREACRHYRLNQEFDDAVHARAERLSRTVRSVAGLSEPLAVPGGTTSTCGLNRGEHYSSAWIPTVRSVTVT